MKLADSVFQAYETELVEKLRSNDSSAVEEFYNTYRDKLYSLVFKQAGRDHAVTEDLVQEILLAALDSLDKFRGDSQIYTWLSNIAYHKIKDSYRRRAREAKLREATLAIDAIELEAIEHTESIASSMMESEETRQTVRHALLGLPGDYRRVLVLKYIDRMPVLQISQVMHRSPKSVEGLLSRARKALCTNLAEADKSD